MKEGIRATTIQNANYIQRYVWMSIDKKFWDIGRARLPNVRQLLSKELIVVKSPKHLRPLNVPSRGFRVLVGVASAAQQWRTSMVALSAHAQITRGSARVPVSQHA